MFSLKNASGWQLIQVTPGVLLIEALAEAGLAVEDTSCGRQGVCAKCLVRTRSTENEEWAEVLACQTPVISDLEIDMPDPERLRKFVAVCQGSGIQVAPEPAVRKLFVKSLPGEMALAWEELCAAAGIPHKSTSPENVGLLRELARLVTANKSFTAIIAEDKILGLEEGDTSAALYGMAFDVGTTTVVGYLSDLLTGKLLAAVSALNPQVRYGADVITRITLAEREPHGLQQLQDCIVACVNELIGEAAAEAGIRREDIYDFVFVGNPCMEHIFLGIQPAGLGKAPYQPVLREQVTFTAAEVGVQANELARVCWLPAVAGFVGADTVGMLLAHPLAESAETTLALDIGTNGEIVLACRRELRACSTAAGPAFEGTAMTSGLRAQSGAIDRVWVGKQGWQYHVIDGIRPRGICGSGVVDAVAALLNQGLITESGRLTRPDNGHPLARNFVTHEGAAAFVLVSGDAAENGKDILITQNDVRQLQLAKAAVATGLFLLLQEAQVSLQDVARVILAGAFGMYLTLESIRTIGLIPEELCGKVVAVGNAAGAGAQNALISTRSRRLAAHTAAKIRYVELAGRLDFADLFVERLGFARRIGSPPPIDSSGRNSS